MAESDHERLLLAKVLRDRAMPALLEAKIGEEFFLDAEHLGVLRWMHEHWKRHGSSPSVQALKADKPNYELPDTPEPLSYYIDRVRLAFKYDVMYEAVQVVTDELIEHADVDKAIMRVSGALAEVNAVASPLNDHDLTDPEVFDRRFDFYASLTENPGALRGYATGWPTIDLATMGLQSRQLITFVGPPKGGKSTILLSVADTVNKAGHSVLLVSFEMSYEEQEARWIGLRAGLNYRRLLKGKMNDADERRMNRVLKQLRKERAPFILSEDISSTTTVGGVIAKVQQYKPELVVIDGVYLMTDENGEPQGSPQAITNITRSLKRVAQVFEVPVVISTQTLLSKMRGGRVSAASIGYSSSFGQDSDTVIGVEPKEHPETGEPQHWLKVLLSRSGPQVETQIEFDWSTSTFTEHANEWTGPDPDEDDDGEVRVA